MAFALFWPFLHATPLKYRSFIKGVFFSPRIDGLLCEGPGQKVIYKTKPSVFNACPKFNMLALRLDFCNNSPF